MARAEATQINSQVQISGDQYRQDIHVHFSGTYPVSEFVNTLRNADMIQIFNRRVRSAKFSLPKVPAAGAVDMQLVVGGYGIYFQHHYACQETLTANEYLRACRQVQAGGRFVVQNSSMQLRCISRTATPSQNSFCEYHHTGLASSFQIPMIKTVTNFEMAANLYFYEVGYFSQISMVLSGFKEEPKKLKKIFNENAEFAWYRQLEVDLDAAVANHKRLPKEEQPRLVTIGHERSIAVMEGQLAQTLVKAE